METYIKIGNQYYGQTETIFVIEQSKLLTNIEAFWGNINPIISEIPEIEYHNKIEKDIDEEYETLT